MKKFLLAMMLFSTVAAQASEVITVLEAGLPYLRTGRTEVDTRFQMDTATKEGFVKVTVSELETIYQPPMGCHYGPYDYPYPYPYPGRHYPYPHGGGYRNCYPMPTTVARTIFEDTVKVDNLMLVDNKVIYLGVNGEVECGTLGRSRVLRMPTIFLTGKCELTGRVMRTRTDSSINVTLRTK
jgi:hypothetical protein